MARRNTGAPLKIKYQILNKLGTYRIMFPIPKYIDNNFLKNCNQLTRKAAVSTVQKPHKGMLRRFTPKQKAINKTLFGAFNPSKFIANKKRAQRQDSDGEELVQ